MTGFFNDCSVVNPKQSTCTAVLALGKSSATNKPYLVIVATLMFLSSVVEDTCNPLFGFDVVFAEFRLKIFIWFKSWMFDCLQKALIVLTKFSSLQLFARREDWRIWSSQTEKLSKTAWSTITFHKLDLYKRVLSLSRADYGRIIFILRFSCLNPNDCFSFVELF